MKIKTVGITIISTLVLIFAQNEGAKGHDVLLPQPSEYVSSFWKNWCLHLEFTMMTIENPADVQKVFPPWLLEQQRECLDLIEPWEYEFLRVNALEQRNEQKTPEPMNGPQDHETQVRILKKADQRQRRHLSQALQQIIENMEAEKRASDVDEVIAVPMYKVQRGLHRVGRQSHFMRMLRSQPPLEAPTGNGNEAPRQQNFMRMLRQIMIDSAAVKSVKADKDGYFRRMLKRTKEIESIKRYQNHHFGRMLRSDPKMDCRRQPNSCAPKAGDKNDPSKIRDMYYMRPI